MAEAWEGWRIGNDIRLGWRETVHPPIQFPIPASMRLSADSLAEQCIHSCWAIFRNFSFFSISLFICLFIYSSIYLIFFWQHSMLKVWVGTNLHHFPEQGCFSTWKSLEAMNLKKLLICFLRHVEADVTPIWLGWRLALLVLKTSGGSIFHGCSSLPALALLFLGLEPQNLTVTLCS